MSTFKRNSYALVNDHWFAVLCSFVFLGAVLFIRIGFGFEFPIPWNDETAFISQAFEYSQTGSFFVYGLNSERVVMWMPPGYMLLLSGVYKIWGYSYELTRWISSLLYILSYGICLYIITNALKGWRLKFALACLLLAFISPFSLAISNIARMEALYTFLFLFSLLFALKGHIVLGLSVVLLSATVHYNAIYFLLPYAVFIVLKIAKQENLIVSAKELLTLSMVFILLLIYAFFILKNLDGFISDMKFQFAFKSIFQ